MVKRIGWLQQNINNVVGGAEMSTNALMAEKPDWAEIIYCPPNERPNTDELDCFVIQNSTVYRSNWIEELAMKPVIRHVRDPWYAGSAILRRWLLENADCLIFSSPIQLENMGYEIPEDRRVEIIPVPVMLAPFREKALPLGERAGAVFVGRTDIFKGMPAVIDWAIRENEQLLIIGDRSYIDGGLMYLNELPENIQIVGKVANNMLPDILGKAEKYVAMPEWPEAFGRSVAEAWAAGCELILKGRVGAQYWIENEPERLGYLGPITEFWNIVWEVLQDVKEVSR